jgi:hypothetical protein
MLERKQYAKDKTEKIVVLIFCVLVIISMMMIKLL